MFWNPLSDQKLQEKYLETGKLFAAMWYMRPCAKAVGFDKTFKQWEKLEKEYAQRGYRTVSQSDFYQMGIDSDLAKELMPTKREEGEEPIFHAAVIKELKKTPLKFRIFNRHGEQIGEKVEKI